MINDTYWILYRRLDLDNIIEYLTWILWFLGLSYGTDDQSLKEAFSGFGEVTDGELYW